MQNENSQISLKQKKFTHKTCSKQYF